MMKTKANKSESSVKSSNVFFSKHIDSGFFAVQPKLIIGQPGDKYEQEADRVAEQVVYAQTEKQSFFTPAQTVTLQTKPLAETVTPLVQKQEEEAQTKLEVQRQEEESEEEELQPKLEIQRQEEEEEMMQMQTLEEEEMMQMQPLEEEEEMLQAQEEEEEELMPKLDAEVVQQKQTTEQNLKNTKENGSSLDKETRLQMENSFGVDFSGVKIHTDNTAVQLSQNIGAQAFTSGNNIYFNEGKYQPHSQNGKRLLAHELTHTIQQGNTKVQPVVQREVEGDLTNNTIAGEQEKAIKKKNILSENEESMTIKQKAVSPNLKTDHIVHSVGTETKVGRNGHLSEWITVKHTVYKDGIFFKVRLDELNIHTQVYIWPEGNNRWDKIEDFAPYYNKPYDPVFNLYKGSFNHEKQHAKETVDAFNMYEPSFKLIVGMILGNTKASAETMFQSLFNAFDQSHNAEYWRSGEALAEAVEWKYYHSEFEKFVADPISYGLIDWNISDAEARKVLKILEQLKAVNVPTFKKMVLALKAKGVLNNLLDNISKSDKATYKRLIADIYLLL